MTRTVCGLVLGFLLAALVGVAGRMTPAAAQDKKKDKGGPAAGAVFEVYEDAGGKYRFRLKSGDASLAIAPRGFANRQECRKVVERIQREAARARVVDLPKDKPRDKGKGKPGEK